WPPQTTCADRAPPEAQAIFCRRRHQPRRPPPAKIRPGSPAPTMGPGTAVNVTGPSTKLTPSEKNEEAPHLTEGDDTLIHNPTGELATKTALVIAPSATVKELKEAKGGRSTANGADGATIADG